MLDKFLHAGCLWYDVMVVEKVNQCHVLTHPVFQRAVKVILQIELRPL